MNRYFQGYHPQPILLRLVAIAGACCCFQTLIADEPLPTNIGFNRDIRPILSDTCFKCHGPDEAQRKADMRLDVREAIFGDDSAGPIVRGKPNESELFRRITSDDPDERMPPAGSGLALSKQQIDIIRQWIEQGAPWQQHWSFVRPSQPSLAGFKDPSWQRTPIDHFVLDRLQAEKLAPSKTADKFTLIRRMSMDLTGLPPTPDEVAAFTADDAPDAYDRLADRLLASPRYGERMAIRWLDLARYADTSGYQNDGPRYMWRWRDWVIDAYNQGMPFDQFTIEQIAGDLLAAGPKLDPRGETLVENPTRLNQMIATAFNRNHRGNAEGGIVAEEFQVEYVIDRVETTATVWLGLTAGCGRCHDHKYDPLTQKEFYQLFAFFNQVPEHGRAIKEGNSPPFIKAPTPIQQRRLAKLQQTARVAAARFQKLEKELNAAQRDWERSLDTNKPLDWTVSKGLIAAFELDAKPDSSSRPEPAEGGEPSYVDGVKGKALQVRDGQFLNVGDVGNFGYFDKFSIAFWARAAGDGTLLSRMTPESRGDGYYVHLENGHLQVNLVKRWLDDSIRVETKTKLPLKSWHHIAVTYDGSRIADGISIYVDGRLQPQQANHDFLNQTFASEEPLRIGKGHGNFHGSIDDVRIYSRCLIPSEVEIASAAAPINEIVAKAPDHRTPAERTKLRDYFLAAPGKDRFGKIHQKRIAAQQALDQFKENLPTLMVMMEMEQPRSTHLLLRGQYDKPGDPVKAGVPSVLPPLPKGAPANRLSLARWLVDRDNPLTSRVAVNRYWQQFFGSGLVATMENFGAQGAPPSHPELFDWMATKFATDWDVKRMLRLIALSATYRQSSDVTPELIERDPNNHLFARGPRVRLAAELVRDQALAIGGLLVERLGGESVKVYQPEGLWNEIATDTSYELAAGGDLYRRSLYSYWKRTVSPPSMATFDAPSREACVVQRPLTNTPLQALAIMNDTTYVEAARGVAECVMHEDFSKADERISRMFQLATSRLPHASELAILKRAFDAYLAAFQADRKAADKLVHVGQSSPDGSLDLNQLAAYTVVASLILNLDETITKE